MSKERQNLSKQWVWFLTLCTTQVDANDCLFKETSDPVWPVWCWAKMTSKRLVQTLELNFGWILDIYAHLCPASTYLGRITQKHFWKNGIVKCSSLTYIWHSWIISCFFLPFTYTTHKNHTLLDPARSGAACSMDPTSFGCRHVAFSTITSPWWDL